MWSKINRLQLATRLNLALRYKRGVGLDVGLLLRHRRYAREALELCQESGDSGLSDLASQFEDATAAEDAKAHLAIAATTTRAELAELQRFPTAAASVQTAASKSIRAWPSAT